LEAREEGKPQERYPPRTWFNSKMQGSVSYYKHMKPAAREPPLFLHQERIMYAPSTLDLLILKEIKQKEGKSIREVCTRFFPGYSEAHIRERIRLLTVSGYVQKTSREYRHTIQVTPAGLAIIQDKKVTA